MIENIRFSSVMPWLFEKDIAKLNETRAIIAAASQKNPPIAKVIKPFTPSGCLNLEKNVSNGNNITKKIPSLPQWA